MVHSLNQQALCYIRLSIVFFNSHMYLIDYLTCHGRSGPAIELSHAKIKKNIKKHKKHLFILKGGVPAYGA